MNKKTITMALLSLMISGMAVRAAQIGDTVQSTVNVLQRFHANSGAVTVVTSIPLEDGVWNVTGTVGTFFRGDNGETVFLGGALQPVTPTMDFADGFTFLDSVVIWNTRADRAIPLAGRDVDINAAPGTTKNVYLMVWFYPGGNTPSVSDVYGFISARKIRNNH